MNEKNQMDDLMQMASRAGFERKQNMIWVDGWEITPPLHRFAQLVAKKAVEAEREACAKVCEAEAEKWKKKDLLGYVAVLVDDAAAAIRARRQA